MFTSDIGSKDYQLSYRRNAGVIGRGIEYTFRTFEYMTFAHSLYATQFNNFHLYCSIKHYHQQDHCAKLVWSGTKNVTW
jgi:hypothetical protein